MARIGSACPCRLGVERLEDRAVPATFTVNSTLDNLTPGDGKLTLREAIAKANDLPGADVIVVPAGVFKISLPGHDDANRTGDFDIGDSVTIRGAGRSKTFIDGQRLDRVFHASFPELMRLELRGMTIRNGWASDYYGGGVLVENANLTLLGCNVTGNRSFNGGSITQIRSPESSTVSLVLCAVTNNNSLAGSGAGVCVNDAKLLTVTDSVIRQNVSRYLGGGISANDVELTGCTVSDNSAGTFGGGILGREVKLRRCTVSDNTAGADGPIRGNGGGISASSANVVNSTISGNVAAGNGGGISATEATMTRCTVSGNSAGISGGGIDATTAALDNSTVSGNTASGGNGGGIHATTALPFGCTVSGNAARHGGGGIFASAALPFGCTVSGNTAGLNGGGIHADAGTLINCTVVKNLATTGGGLFHTAFGTLNVKNTIVALNLFGTGGAATDISGDFASGGHNLIGDGTGGTGFVHGLSGDIVGDAVNPIDPKLGPLANNGGPTKTHKLLAGSLAIDAGDNADLPPTDQRGIGFPRKKDGNGDGRAVVDIGAFER